MEKKLAKKQIEAIVMNIKAFGKWNRRKIIEMLALDR